MGRGRGVLIVDDEKPARVRLTALLERHSGVQLAAACSGGEAALEAVSAAARSGAPVDIIFLDVQMPEMDGFVMLESLYTLPLTPTPVIVLATAYHEYALRAFAAPPPHYPLKPHTTHRFQS